MNHKKLTLKSLKKAAEELNEVINLDVPINVDEGSVDSLKEDIKEVSELIIESDEVSEDTLDIIHHVTMGKLGKEKKEKMETKKAETKKAETKKVDTKKMETKKSETKKVNTKKMETKKVNTKADTDGEPCRPTAAETKKALKYGDLKNGKEKSDFRRKFVVAWIEKEKYTRKDIIEMHMELFPETAKNTISTFLSGSTNEKNNLLDSLVKKNEKGILCFV